LLLLLLLLFFFLSVLHLSTQTYIHQMHSS
jgi:hypothetical protein